MDYDTDYIIQETSPNSEHSFIEVKCGKRLIAILGMFLGFVCSVMVLLKDRKVVNTSGTILITFLALFIVFSVLFVILSVLLLLATLENNTELMAHYVYYSMMYLCLQLVLAIVIPVVLVWDDRPLTPMVLTWMVIVLIVGLECGISNINRRIDGGKTAQPHQYPWMVALMLGVKVHCGGAIITDKHVLSAGHCVSYDVSFRELKARIGMHDLYDQSYQVLNIVHGVKHPGFASNTVRDVNDIAVFTLHRRLHFNDRILPICLPTEKMIFGGSPHIVAGWGKLNKYDATPSQFLQETVVKVVDGNTCKKTTIYKDYLNSNTMMCGYTTGNGICQGDSGGPLFASHSTGSHKKWFHVGIVSWGTDCASAVYPGVYTKVDKYIGWIKQQTADGLYCV